MRSTGLRVVDATTGGRPSALAAAVHALLFYVAVSTFCSGPATSCSACSRDDRRFGHDLADRADGRSCAELTGRRCTLRQLVAGRTGTNVILEALSLRSRVLDEGIPGVTSQPRDAPQFYLTSPSACPYLPGKEERKVFTHIIGRRGRELNEILTQGGFRRSQTIAYRPACDTLPRLRLGAGPRGRVRALRQSARGS